MSELRVSREGLATRSQADRVAYFTDDRHGPWLPAIAVNSDATVAYMGAGRFHIYSESSDDVVEMDEGAAAALSIWLSQCITRRLT